MTKTVDLCIIGTGLRPLVITEAAFRSGVASPYGSIWCPGTETYFVLHPLGQCEWNNQTQKEEPAMASMVNSMRTTPKGYFTVRWGQPEYTDWMDESLSWKETCYIGDWSFLWERRFTGPDVLKLFSDISVNSFATFAIGP